MFDTIILDLGGVIEKISPSAVADAFKKLGMTNAGNLFSLLKQSEICSSFELGNISTKTFLQHLKPMCSPKVENRHLELAWCANQLGVSNETVSTLVSLKKRGVKLFILSNTNSIHAKKIEQTFQKKHQKNFQNMFNGVYYSFDIHLRKPNIEAYQYLLAHSRLSPDKCIYIDDLKENLIAPRNLGLHCIHHKTNNELYSHTLIKNMLMPV